jgi:hypothetical protein
MERVWNPCSSACFTVARLSAALNPLLEAGFVLERILEPIPTEQFKQADPKGYEQLSRQPGFLCIGAAKR